MSKFIGEYECKIDSKGRLRLPAQLTKQLGEAARLPMIVNRGFEPHLVIYTQVEWEKTTNQLANLNQFVAQNRAFVRYFHRGASEVLLDSADRILLPKALTEYAKIGSDIVLFAYFDKIEIWSAEEYAALINSEPTDFATLAEQVMGGIAT
jgi:MraZ protein